MKHKVTKAVTAGEVYFGSYPRDKLSLNWESRQFLETSRPEERTPRTFAPTDVSDSEMEGGEEHMKNRAKDDLSSAYEPTDMSDERELENADE